MRQPPRPWGRLGGEVLSWQRSGKMMEKSLWVWKVKQAAESGSRNNLEGQPPGPATTRKAPPGRT